MWMATKFSNAFAFQDDPSDLIQLEMVSSYDLKCSSPEVGGHKPILANHTGFRRS